MPSDTLTMARVLTDPSAHFKGENLAGNESEMTIGAVSLRARTLMALVRMSLELLEDAPNLTAVVENAIAQAISLEMDRSALFGDGVGNPLGIYNAQSIGV